MKKEHAPTTSRTYEEGSSTCSRLVNTWSLFMLLNLIGQLAVKTCFHVIDRIWIIPTRVKDNFVRGDDP